MLLFFLKLFKFLFSLLILTLSEFISLSYFSCFISFISFKAIYALILLILNKSFINCLLSLIIISYFLCSSFIKSVSLIFIKSLFIFFSRKNSGINLHLLFIRRLMEECHFLFLEEPLLLFYSFLLLIILRL